MIDLSHIDTCLSDMDGTLYEYDDGIFEDMHMAKAMALNALSLGKIDLAQAIEITRPYYATYGNFHGGVHSDYGYDPDEAHRRYHTYISTDKVRPLPGLRAAFQAASAAGVRCAVITHSHMELTQRLLQCIDVLDQIEPHHIVTLEQVGVFREKHLDPAMFVEGLQRVGSRPENALVLEDTTKNCTIAKDMGLTTAFIHWGRPLATLPACIDCQFERPDIALQTVAAHRRAALELTR